MRIVLTYSLIKSVPVNTSTGNLYNTSIVKMVRTNPSPLNNQSVPKCGMGYFWRSIDLVYLCSLFSISISLKRNFLG